MKEETRTALMDLVLSMNRLNQQGYAITYSDAIYLTHYDHEIELLQEPYFFGSGVYITGYRILGED